MGYNIVVFVGVYLLVNDWFLLSIFWLLFYINFFVCWCLKDLEKMLVGVIGTN